MDYVPLKVRKSWTREPSCPFCRNIASCKVFDNATGAAYRWHPRDLFCPRVRSSCRPRVYICNARSSVVVKMVVRARVGSEVKPATCDVTSTKYDGIHKTVTLPNTRIFTHTDIRVGTAIVDGKRAYYFFIHYRDILVMDLRLERFGPQILPSWFRLSCVSEPRFLIHGYL